MKKARWILRSATSSLLLAGTGCPDRPPPEEPEYQAVCVPMSAEDWALTRTQPSIADLPEVRSKLDGRLIAFLHNVERVKTGLPAWRYPVWLLGREPNA